MNNRCLLLTVCGLAMLTGIAPLSLYGSADGRVAPLVRAPIEDVLRGFPGGRSSLTGDRRQPIITWRAPSHTAFSQVKYRFLRLDHFDPPHAYTEAWAISNNGKIPVGASSYAYDQTVKAVGWDKTKVFDLLFSDSNHIRSRPIGANDNGWVVGYRDWQGEPRAVILVKYAPDYQDQVLIDLGKGYAYAVNNKNHVVGELAFSTGYRHGFVWQDGKTRDIGVPPGYLCSAAVDINENDVVIGIVGTRKDSAGNCLDARGAIYSNGQWSVLPDPPGHSQWGQPYIGTALVDMRPTGQFPIVAVGRSKYCVTGIFCYPLAFVWQNSVAKELEITYSCGGSTGMSYARGVNDDGVIVGVYGCIYGPWDAFKYNLATDEFVDLNDVPIVPDTAGATVKTARDLGWHLLDAMQISANGTIIGNANFGKGQEAYMLIPVP